jgi:hypothetical protein
MTQPAAQVSRSASVRQKDSESTPNAPTTAKDISYRIVIPIDNSVSGDDVLTLPPSRQRRGGYPGEILVFWLIADWSETTAHLGKVDWQQKQFRPEITNIEFSSRTSHVSTSQLSPSGPVLSPVVREFSAALPLSIKLPVRPAVRAELSVWTEGFETQVIALEISAILPIIYSIAFSVYRNAIRMAFDFSPSFAEVDSFDVRFVPRSDFSLAGYEEAFALRRISETSVFELSFATNEGVQRLKELVLGMTVIWGGNRMVSTFNVELPLPQSPLAIVWTIPRLSRLRQATLSLAVLNISKEPVDASVDIERSALIPLVKNVKIEQLLPQEERKLTLPVVPIITGLHELQYFVTVSGTRYRPLFQTTVRITE